jgi:hypothetical protein
MTRQAEQRPTDPAERRGNGRQDRLNAKAESEELEDAVGAEAKGSEPGIDEIRLQAYYRYLQREDGDDDEIADWLAAESELRARGDASRARSPER